VLSRAAREEVRERGRTHAQRRDADLLVGADELVDERRQEPAAGRAERVPERDRTALGVDLLRVEAKLARDHERLGRERLVELKQVDVVLGDAVVGEQLGQGVRRADAHDDGRHADDGRADPLGEDLEPELVGDVAAHEREGRRAVRDLRRVAGRARAALLEARLELGERLERRLRPDALVLGQDELLDDLGLVALGRRHLAHLDRRDLGGEVARVLRRLGLGVRRAGELVLVLARDAVLFGDGLGRRAHRGEAVLRVLRVRLLDVGRDAGGDGAGLQERVERGQLSGLQGIRAVEQGERDARRSRGSWTLRRTQCPCR